MYDKQFTVENFVEYAVEMHLRCRLAIECNQLERTVIRQYWSIIEPVLKSALQRPKTL